MGVEEIHKLISFVIFSIFNHVAVNGSFYSHLIGVRDFFSSSFVSLINLINWLSLSYK